MEVPGLGAELELQLQAFATATAMPDLSHICDLHQSLQQHWILNPLSEARDQTCILMDISWVLNLLSHNTNSQSLSFSICFNPFFFSFFSFLGPDSQHMEVPRLGVELELQLPDYATATTLL